MSDVINYRPYMTCLKLKNLVWSMVLFWPSLILSMIRSVLHCPWCTVRESLLCSWALDRNIQTWRDWMWRMLWIFCWIRVSWLFDGVVWRVCLKFQYSNKQKDTKTQQIGQLERLLWREKIFGIHGRERRVISILTEAIPLYYTNTNTLNVVTD